MGKCKLCNGTGKKRACTYLKDWSWTGKQIKTVASCNMYEWDDMGCDCKLVKCSCQACYISTACITAFGKTDDCNELNLLRKFRDTYVKIYHPNDVEKYYAQAPKIVNFINNQRNKIEIYSELWYDKILPCINLIETNQFETAYNLYKSTALDLQNKYIINTIVR